MQFRHFSNANGDFFARRRLSAALSAKTSMASHRVIAALE
jgi:hypothetical protein